MSDEKTNVISYEEKVRAEIRGLAKRVEAPSAGTISTKGKVFKLPGGQSSSQPMEVIVLDFINYNSFYEGVYNQNNPQPPACFAVGEEIDSLVPSDNSPKKQHATCDGCPKSEWGTGASGKGKACKNQRRLLIAPVDFTE